MADVVKSEDQKPGSHINLKVKSQDGSEVHFKIKKTSTFQKLMDAYCNRQGVAVDSVRFVFDGKRLQATETPEALEMEDGDSIDAMIQQVGGKSTYRSA
mmetsp:Transcript_38717/g.62714  ORF Transcript_38717/g.62714 Transcript_38717/m.62714 type:complete len:99 (+) Transcript_38717:180-476(+)|eukprot:CAMPEP_0184344060 /NCGR_PEP_ID=MMETSP1089-20130417/12578_1 /TAXON_ID=38269 ORGANISM="Gloeochaete wittrockiana, Strain SAG46.84" /NCGR_SAMPLE_ID=MMETSP1089 /ASSEMBLY_ACC=CAM_ASM_000445 /LENGTH=98 /DNA_ID=CAMNT_0026673701 /DNA_START=142 /DNA_END=438 /DNA_ORIENTATION=+